jgi:hypothetical protein
MAELTVARSRRRVVALRPEGAYGQDAFAGAVAASDVLYAFNIRKMSKIETIDMMAQCGAMGRLRGTSGVGTFGLSFDVQLRGPGAAYAVGVLSDVHHLWRLAGVKATLDATAGHEIWTMTKQSTGFEAYTVYDIQENGPCRAGVGCFATLQIKFVGGQPAVASVNILGKLLDDQPLELVVKTPTFLPAPAFKSADFKVGLEEYPARIKNLTLSVMPTISVVDDANAENAVLGYSIVDTEISGSFDPEMTLLETFDWFTLWKEKPPGVACSFTLGAAQYNRFDFAFPGIEIQSDDEAERNGIRANQIGWKARPALALDDEMSVVER